MVDYALETSICLMKIVFAKGKTAKFFRLRRATNAKTTINMNKRHIYYLNVFFQPAAGEKIGVFLPYKPPLVSTHSKTRAVKDIS